MTAQDASASGNDGHLRLAVVLVATGLLLVPWGLARQVPGLAAPFVYPGLPFGMAFTGAWIIPALFLGSAVLLLVRWDVGALALAIGLLAWGLWGALQGGWPVRSFWGLASPLCLVAGTLVLAFRGRPVPLVAARRCPACGTVQGAAGGTADAAGTVRCELCGFDLPPGVVVAGGAAAGPRWGHVSVAVFFGALGLLALGALAVLSQLGGGGRMPGWVPLVLLGLALGGWVFGAAAGLVGWARARQDGREPVGYGVAGALLNLLPLALPLLYLASVRWRDYSRLVPPPAVRPPVASPVTPAPRLPVPATRETAVAQLAQARDLLRQGRDAEAERLVTGALLFLDPLAHSEPATWDARRLMAETLMRQKKYSQAEGALRFWDRDFQTLPRPLAPEWQARRAVWLDQMAGVCEATGRAAEAARLRAERGRPAWELAPPPREVP